VRTTPNEARAAVLALRTDVGTGSAGLRLGSPLCEGGAIPMQRVLEVLGGGHALDISPNSRAPRPGSNGCAFHDGPVTRFSVHGEPPFDGLPLHRSIAARVARRRRRVEWLTVGRDKRRTKAPIDAWGRPPFDDYRSAAMLLASSSVKARTVSVRTLPRPAAASASLATVWSSGASLTTTASYWPIVR
jgi:hypothetical protein